MRQLRQTLRLHLEAGLSLRECSRVLGICKTTIGEIVRDAGGEREMSGHACTPGRVGDGVTIGRPWLLRGPKAVARAKAPVQTVHADFPHTAYQWPVGSQHYASFSCKKDCTEKPISTPAEGRHSPAGDRTKRGNTGCPVLLGCGPELPLQLSHFVARHQVDGVVRHGLAGHSLALTRSTSMTTAGTLPSSRVMPHGLRRSLRPVRYYDPLGLPLRTPRLRLGLIRARLPRQGLRRRASRVPLHSLHTCYAPYPAAATSALRISLG